MSLFNQIKKMVFPEDITPNVLDQEFFNLYGGLNKYISEPVNWTPSYSASGLMTFTSVTTHYAYYSIIGKNVFFSIYATGTVGGTPDTQLRFTLPLVPDNDVANGVAGGGFVIDGSYRGGFFAHSGVSNTIAVTRYDFATWSAGTGRGFAISGFYKKTL